jgi:uncharacterized RDD family membrane protein YckC
MADTSSGRFGTSFQPQPHPYDPAAHPEYFEGVLARRMMAFVIDVIVITLPVLLATFFILLFGVVTLGLGWFLFWLLPAGATIWAIFYYGFTLGSPASATLGMRVMDLQMRTWYGAPAYFLLGAVHAIGYWISVSTLTPLILLVAFFNQRRRLLHDIVLGTIVVNNEARAQARLGRAGELARGSR